MLKEGQEFSELRDSYMVLIMQIDIFGCGLPIYTINRHFEYVFDDGSHIVYVNGSYKGNDAVGRLIHDFGCKKSKDIYYPELAKGVKHFKEEENIMGGTIIETESERLMRMGANQGAAGMIVKLGQKYGLNDEEILKQMQEKSRSVFRNGKTLSGTV